MQMSGLYIYATNTDDRIYAFHANAAAHHRCALRTGWGDGQVGDYWRCICKFVGWRAVADERERLLLVAIYTVASIRVCVYALQLVMAGDGWHGATTA